MGVFRARWGLRAASPGESKWHPIKSIHQYTLGALQERILGREEPGSIQPQTKKMLEPGGFPIQEEPAGLRMSYSEKNTRGRKVA